MVSRFLALFLAASWVAAVPRGCDRSQRDTSDMAATEGVTRVQPNATTQPTRRKEGQTEVPELYREAAAALDRNDTARAEELYRKCLAAEPDNAQGYIGLGTVALHTGALDTARTQYENALAMDPRSASAHLGLGSVAHVKGDHKRAITEYGTVLELRGEDADAHWGLALSYDALGDTAKARMHAQKFISLAPQSPLVPQMRRIASGA
jgi:Flp pilus assembly protein TadD